MSGDVSILAGGWSVKGEGVDLNALPGFVIGVNDAFRYTPVNMIISMDRLWAEARWELLEMRERPAWLRRSAVQNIKDRPYWLTVFECSNTSAEFAELGNEKILNGGNSGYCALNFAYLIRPSRLFLYGFDMRKGPNGEPYWYPPYEWAPSGAGGNKKFVSWITQFKTAADYFEKIGTKVYVVGKRSLITEFEKISPEKAKEMGR